jgi:hypothetical protein
MPYRPFAQVSVQDQGQLAIGQVFDTGLNHFEDLPNPGRARQTHAVVITAPVAATTYTITVPALGASLPFVSTGTANTDRDAAIIAWNADPILRSAYVASNGGAGSVLLTAVAFDLDLGITVDAPAVLVVTTTPANAGVNFRAGRPVWQGSGIIQATAPAGTNDTNALNRFVGIVTRRYDEEGTTPSNEPYQQNSPKRVEVITSGRIVVADGDTAAYRDPLYIGVGANDGLFFNAAGANRALIPAHLGYWSGPHVVNLRYGR